MERSDQPDPGAPTTGTAKLRLWPRRWRYRGLLALVLALLVSGSAAWIDRDRIIGNLINNYLAENGVPATYDLVEITPARQVIANLVVGDPAAPDLVAERVVIDLGLGLVGPAIERVTVERARLAGSFVDGKLSLGALDPLVFTASDEPARLPQITVTLRDARMRIASDFGVIAGKLEGAGRLDDGFAGTLALTAPGIGTPECRAARATMFGALSTAKGQPKFTGPVRIAGAQCAGAQLARADINAAITLPATLDEARGTFAIDATTLTAAGAQAQRITGQASAAVSATNLVVEHDLAASGIAAPYARIGDVRARGAWRTAGAERRAAARSEWSGEIAASALALDELAQNDLAAARSAAAGTLAEPLLGQITDNLAGALEGASFASEAIIRSGGDDLRLIIPEARLRSGAGEVIMALSQVNWQLGAAQDSVEKAGGRGNFMTGGRGLPRINGRISDNGAGGISLRLAMADYTAGTSRLAIPRLSVEGDTRGSYRFSGLLMASGTVPGGQISGLELPVEGVWSKAQGLTAGQRCTNVRFAGLSLAALELSERKIALCPADGRAMLRYGDALEVGIASRNLALQGALGGSAARISAEQAILRYPGALAITGLEAVLGDAGSAPTRLTLASLTGALGAAPSGAFSGGTAVLGDVAFALGDLTGIWAFPADGLQIDDAAFTLTDRTPGQPRFEPVSARGGALRMKGDDIAAEAALHNPPSGRKLALVRLGHNLASSRGHADILVDDLTFGPGLDAENLTYLAKGVVAFAKGTVRGAGRVDWRGDTVTSNGRFASDGLDFAAAFGPVSGLRGEIAFTDLIALTTAPDQQLAIGAINTGVEVLDGRVTFALTNGQTIAISDASWPFMDGRLVLRPVVLDFSRPSEKRYEFELIGLDAATFIAEMELSNLSVTGKFDGTVPIVFDSSGNGRVEQGLLRARPPGGNVAYIGDLTYEDMGAISNYAFRALRSLDYRDMSVILDGSLTGEIVSKFQFQGVRQGEGASRNFITKRLARLPILFRVNVKAESFLELSTVVRSFFDVNMLGNPIDRGLLRAEGGRFVPAQPEDARAPDAPGSDPSAAKRAPLRPQDNFVQPPESDDRP